jgi:tetratricopeptide (TPR) repeat protein
MKTSLSLFLLSLALAVSPVYAGPPAQPGTGILAQDANSWSPVKLRATQSLTLPKGHPKLKALAARTQKDLEAIDRTMVQIGELKSSKRPNKDVARRILGQLRQYRMQLQQTEKELSAIGKSRSDRKTDLDRKREEAARQQYDDAIETAKQKYDEAKEQFKKALKILIEHVERESQVVQKITS